MTWSTMAEVRAANAKKGDCWFSRSTMRFFKSKVFPTIYNGRYFVTSERPPHGKTEYTVRVVDDDGGVNKIISGFGSLSDARHWAKFHAPSPEVKS